MIVASAPVRICDFGGWTDTWFGGPGRVVNLAVRPGVEVTIRPTDGPDPVVLALASFGDRYPVVPGERRRALHPLAEAAVDALPPPPDQAVEIVVRSEIPPGCGTGTSASMAVALLGALAVLRHAEWSARGIAQAAHRLETDVLGLQSGVQDQLSAALGGINSLEIDPYPASRIEQLPPWPELGEHVSLVYLGQSHDSSKLHQEVIQRLGARRSSAFERLRYAAVGARKAVLAQDLSLFGAAMVANTNAQRALYDGLVADDARQVIRRARQLGALGWKVNGAGGDGGSITLLSATLDDRSVLEAGVRDLSPDYETIDVEISSTGLVVEASGTG